jgi:glycosyltransferase involved in cell wall biosynthesis
LEKIIHFIKPKGLSIGVFKSQLLNLAKQIRCRNTQFCTKVWVTNEDSKILKTFDTYKNTLRRKDISYGDIIYLRSPIDYILHRLLLLGLGVKFIYDFRALVAFESWYRNRKIGSFIILFILECIAYFTSHQVNCVSNKLRMKLDKYFFIKRNVIVVPCLTETATLKQFNNNKAKSIDFVYVGGTSKWQCIEEIFKIYKKIEEQVNNSTLTFFTKDKDLIDQYSLKYGIAVDVKFVDQQNIHNELLNYDFGFLLRESNIINEVASPIKFLEYLGAGVVPIMTNEIGDYSGLVVNNKLGVIVDKNDTNIQDLVSNIKNHAKDNGINNLIYRVACKLTWNGFEGDLLRDDIFN